MPMTGDELAAHYRVQIENGELAAGAKLPSLTELQATFGVGKGVAQQMIGKLRAEGLIESRQGAGNFVRGNVERADLASHWADAVAQRGNPAFAATLLQVGEVEPPPFVRTELGIKEGEPVVLRQSRVDVRDAPAHIEWVYYPADLAKGSAIVYTDTGDGGIYARLADLGLPVDRFVERFVARLARPDELDALKLRAGSPVLEVWRTAWSGERAVEAGRAVLNAERYQVVHDSRFTVQ